MICMHAHLLIVYVFVLCKITMNSRTQFTHMFLLILIKKRPLVNYFNASVKLPSGNLV